MERCRRLAQAANCIDCRSERDWSRYAGPIKPGTEGRGGELFPGEYGKLYSKNNTPAHFHCLIPDGVFSTGSNGEARFHEAIDLDDEALAWAQAQVRRRGWS